MLAAPPEPLFAHPSMLSMAGLPRPLRPSPYLLFSRRSLSPILAATFMPPRGRPTLVVLSPAPSGPLSSAASSCGSFALLYALAVTLCGLVLQRRRHLPSPWPLLSRLLSPFGVTPLSLQLYLGSSRLPNKDKRYLSHPSFVELRLQQNKTLRLSSSLTQEPSF